MHRLSCPLRFAVGLAVVCFGCGSTSDPAVPPASSVHLGGQTGGEAGIRCSATVAVEPLAFGATSPLGFSAADIESWLPKSAARPLAWTDGSSAVLDLSLGYAGTAGYAATCRSNAVDVTLTLTTSDGALAESAPARLFCGATKRPALDLALDVATLSGSLATTHPALVAPGDQVVFQIDFADGTPSGRMTTDHANDYPEIAAF